MLEKDRAAKEQRRVWRMKLSLKVVTSTGAMTVTSWTDNVGGGGLKFASDVKFEPGERIELQMPEFSSYAVFPCKVLECAVLEFTRKYETRITFVDVDKKLLDSLLEYAYRSAVQNGISLARE